MDVYDIACDTLPCTPSLLSNISVGISPGDTALDISQIVADILFQPAGCSIELIAPPESHRLLDDAEVGFRMTCADFMPKFLICEDPGGPCPNVFEIDIGTDPDIGVVLADFRFFTEEAGQPPTAPTCGDGVVNPLFEQCDDGNMVDGDGCDNNCRHSITTPPNSCADPFNCTFDGFLNEALGNATLSFVQGDTVLLVEGIGSTGLDGVRQYVPDTTEMRTDLVKPNFSLSVSGTELVTTQIGVVDGMDSQLFSALTITNDGNSLQILGDWSPIGNTSYNIRIYLDQLLVTDQRGLASGLLSFPMQDIGGLDCDVNGELTGDTHPPVLVTIPGRGDFFGDNWVIATENATSTAEAQQIIEMLASDTGPLQLAHEFTNPPPGPVVTFFSDGFESGDTSSWPSMSEGER